MRPGKVPDYHLLLEIVDYLTHYPDQYHHPREDLLFTRMLESDSKFRRKLDRLEREHDTLLHFTHELFNAVFPGGGFVMRTPTQHKGFVAKICRAANARALLVHYRLAPEVPFPGGLEDCLAAYHDLLQQGVEPADITVAGDSAGGEAVVKRLCAATHTPPRAGVRYKSWFHFARLTTVVDETGSIIRVS